jgi:hypothetical protein
MFCCVPMCFVVLMIQRGVHTPHMKGFRQTPLQMSIALTWSGISTTGTIQLVTYKTYIIPGFTVPDT